MTLDEFKEKLLAYLHVEQEFGKQDIENQKIMSRDEKIEAGVLLPNITILAQEDGVFDLHVPNNYSKLRAGDKVIIRAEKENASKVPAVIIDNLIDTITVFCEKELEHAVSYEIEIQYPKLLQALIGCLEGIAPAKPGAAFLRYLASEIPLEVEEFLHLNPEEISGYMSIFNDLNECQQQAVRSMLDFPPIHVLQGPPGTGKTKVLAATAIAAAKANREVVIIANTHHAVNNALLKIQEMAPKTAIFKIGEQLKAEELGDGILKCGNFKEYSEYCRINRKKKKSGHVVGMTIWGAITFLGLHQHTHFRPYFALVDEASQMPLSYASILGKCASSICLFGDSKQMPPIFRPELEGNELSISILDYCAKILQAPTVALNMTYRMNKEITQYVSSHFYEPEIVLQSSDDSANRLFANVAPLRVEKNNIHHEHLLQEQSIIRASYDDMLANHATDYNAHEAKEAAEYVGAALELGLTIEDVAVITPYRAQVKLIRQYVIDKFTALGLDASHLPLIDTVERLQGQDVELIIISMCTTDEKYFEQNKDFLLNPNRLNVMISRTKSKVVIISLKDRYVFN